MKRILIFSLAYYPHVGGAEVAIKEITDRVTDSEFDMVTLRWSLTEAREERIGNVHVYRVGGVPGYLGKALFPLLAATCAWKLHRRNRYNGMWGMMAYMVFPIVLLRMVGVRVPYAVTLQEGDAYDHVFRRIHIIPLVPIMRYGFSNAAVVQTISHFLAGWAVQLGARNPVIIPNGVDAKKFAGDPIRHADTVLVTTSRLVHKNAVDDVIRALPSVPGVHFRIIGTGPDESMLRSLTKELGVQDRVTFVGFLENSKLPEELHKSDIFIRPSRSEGFGISFVEAFAAGLPVIATREGGIADFLTTETGWPVAKDSPADIVAAINDIIARPDHVQKVVAKAKKLTFETYDWDLIAKDMRAKVFNLL